MKNLKNQKGFTLIEILVVIGLIAILAAIVIIAINPARQFAQGRNSQRTSNVNSILNAIGQNIADNKGIFNCPTASIASSTVAVSDADINNSSAVANIMPCLVPTYISSLLTDPTTGSGTATTSYVSGYQISKDVTGRYTLCAPYIEPSINNTKICVTR